MDNSVIAFIVSLIVANLAAGIGFFVSLKVTQAVQGEQIKYIRSQMKLVLKKQGIDEDAEET